jgi:phosphopantetheinyl transferase
VRCLGAALFASARGEPRALPPPTDEERARAATFGSPTRRAEWLHGRAVLRRLGAEVLGVPAEAMAVATGEAGEPLLTAGGRELGGARVSLTHTRRWVVAALCEARVGVDACDALDGARVARVGARAFAPGELEDCGAAASDAHRAAAWALKEAVLKLTLGGVFEPGVASVRVRSLAPPAVEFRVPVEVALLELPGTWVAVARDAPR